MDFFDKLVSFRQHARRLSPEGAIAARGFRLVEDTQSSDEQILAPMRWKNVRQLTYRMISQKVDAGSQTHRLERVLTRGLPVMRGTAG